MEKLYRIWFAEKKSVPKTMTAFLENELGGIENLYNADESVYSKIEGLSKSATEDLLDKSLDGAKKIIDDCEKLGIDIITKESPQFPEVLSHISEPVQVLYVKGNIPDWSNTLKISIVGSRSCTEYGRTATERFASKLAGEGVVVVSGMAMGVDGIAMRAAMNSGGFVVGVMGCGLEEGYPKCNRDIFSELIKSGCAISEYPPYTPPNSWHFPHRNRIVCALSDGVLVTEAKFKSGTLITANIALNTGVPLFSVPADIFKASYTGNNYLLTHGAAAACSAEDIIEAFPREYNAIKRVLSSQNDKEEELSVLTAPEDDWIEDESEKAIVRLLRQKDMDIEELAQKSGISTRDINSHLTILEVEGIIIKLAGARYRYNTEQ